MKYFKPKYKKWYFPTGETGVRVEEFILGEYMVLDYSEEKDIMAWLQIIDAYNRHAPFWNKMVFIPYLPYGRQDKIHSRGESVSLEIFCKLLATLGVKITTVDPHCKSDYYQSFPIPIITGINTNSQKGCRQSLLEDETDIICYPDKNSYQHGIYVKTPFNPIIMDKMRRPNDGGIKMTIENLMHPLDKLRVLIMDDICDGGATFIEAAKILKEKGAGKVSLFITHGIFSKGIDHLYDNGIHHIYTTNSYCKLEPNWKLKIIDIYNGEL